ncbi:MAG: histidine phosphatase family protein [Anaerolineaceae bacterium]|jgi:phosphohistidine phosphatase|nr:histidine phosphatase family protein [Anaerolineaceae bacterium]
MKTLLLMRHAKSSWKDENLSDIERPLKKRGVKDAKLIAKVIKENNLIPDAIISSPAVRTKETVKVLKKELDFNGKEIVAEQLYMGEPESFVEALKSVNNKHNTVLVVAHNPGLEAYLQILGGEIEAVPTGGLGYLVLVLEDWANISLETMGDLVGFWKPKDLREDKK